MTRDEGLERLLRSREPSVRLQTRLRVLREDPDSRPIRSLREEVRRAPRTRELLRKRRRPGRRTPPGVYHKWLGLHWVLASLAELGYPAGDPELLPAVEEAVAFWLRPGFYQEFEPRTEREGRRVGWGVARINGRYRRCASQQGNALWYATTLGLVPDGCDRLAERLLHWQWPDGGWNCDTTPSADTSSFMETLTPMRGLAAYGSARQQPRAREAARTASEVFLRRRLFRRLSDGKVIRGEFLQPHYPLYYHYDVLGGLKALGESDQLRDPRCADALDLLESWEGRDGGWRPTRRYYDLPGEIARKGQERVDWGWRRQGMNEWVTLDALTVLRAAGRYTPDL